MSELELGEVVWTTDGDEVRQYIDSVCGWSFYEHSVDNFTFCPICGREFK